MKKIYEKKVVIKTTCEMEECGAIIAVKLNKTYFFVSSQEYNALVKKHPKRNPIDIVSIVKEYVYYTVDELKQVLKDLQYTNISELIWDASKKDSFRYLKEAVENIKRVLFYERDTGLLYLLDSDIPVSTPVYFDYLRGVSNREYDLDKAYKILSENPWVLELKRKEIPYYNQESDYTNALVFKVLFPEDVWEKLVKKCKKLDPEFWSCRIADHIVYRSYQKSDLLGLKPAYIGKK